MLQLSLPSFSCFFGVGDKEIHMIFNRLVVVLERTSPLEDEKGEGAVAFQRKLDFFDETEEKEGEVWCGVYFGLREEVWVGTSEGWIWRKGATMLEKRKVVGGVTAMAVVGSQVSMLDIHFECFFSYFILFYFILFYFSTDLVWNQPRKNVSF